MILKDANEQNLLEEKEANLQFKTVSTFKRLTSYFRKFFKEKYLYYKELKRQTNYQKLLQEIEKEFEDNENAGVDKKRLAQSIQKTISRYQEIVLSGPEPPQKPQTQKRVLQQQTAFKAGSKVLGSLAFTTTDANCDYKPSQHELDAFRMKAISLMKKNGMMPETISEALKSPIQVNIGEIEEDNDKHLMIKFSQRFDRLGEEFELQGIFLKNIKLKSSHSIPVSDSFQICRKNLELSLKKDDLEPQLVP